MPRRTIKILFLSFFVISFYMYTFSHLGIMAFFAFYLEGWTGLQQCSCLQVVVPATCPDWLADSQDHFQIGWKNGSSLTWFRNLLLSLLGSKSWYNLEIAAISLLWCLKQFPKERGLVLALQTRHVLFYSYSSVHISLFLYIQRYTHNSTKWCITKTHSTIS